MHPAARTSPNPCASWGALSRTCGKDLQRRLVAPALFGIALFSMLTAPLGARLAPRPPVVALKRFFAVFLILTATRMVWGLLG